MNYVENFCCRMDRARPWHGEYEKKIKTPRPVGGNNNNNDDDDETAAAARHFMTSSRSPVGRPTDLAQLPRNAYQSAIGLGQSVVSVTPTCDVLPRACTF